MDDYAGRAEMFFFELLGALLLAVAFIAAGLASYWLSDSRVALALMVGLGCGVCAPISIGRMRLMAKSKQHWIQKDRHTLGLARLSMLPLAWCVIYLAII